MWTTTRFTDDLIRDFLELPTQRHTQFVSSNRLAIDVKDDVLNIGLLVTGHSAETLELNYESDKIKVNSITLEKLDKVKEELIIPINETLAIGKDWDGAKAQVSIKDGILYISVPKFEERKSKKLSIKVG